MPEKNLSFLEMLQVLKQKGNGWRCCQENTPGVVGWIYQGVFQTNLPVPIEAYLAGNWAVFQDDTVIR